MFKRILIGRLMDEAGEADGGGGNPAPESKTFTQDAVNALLAKERRAFEAKLKEHATKATDADTLRAELEKLREEKELAGKSELERFERKYQTDVAALQRQIAERDTAAKAAAEALHRERVGTRLQAELGRAKVMPAHLDKAVKLASLELADVTIGDDGRVTATFGDLIDKPIADVIAAWVKENDFLLPAPSGGAGTRSPNGLPAGKKLTQLSNDELIAAGNARRNASR